MKIPVSTRVGGAASTTNPRYLAVVGGGVYTASINTSRTPITMNVVVSNLYVKLKTASTVGSYLIELLVNGVADPSFKVTMGVGVSEASYTATTVAVSAGQSLEWRITPTSSPDSLGVTGGLFISVIMESSVARKAPMFAGHSTGTGAYFIPPSGISVITTEGFGSCVMPVAGEFTGMRVRLTTAPGGSVTRRYTLRKNGVDDPNFFVDLGPSDTSATVTATVAYAVGDVITIAATATGGTPASSHAGIGLTWEPTVNGYFPLLACITSGFATTGDRYATPSGTVPGNTSTEGDAYTVIPDSITIDNMYASISTAPGASKSRAFTLKINGVAQALTTTLSGAGSGLGVLYNIDSSHPIQATAGQYAGIVETPTGVPAAPATYNYIGMRGFITPLEGARGGPGTGMLGVG